MLRKPECTDFSSSQGFKGEEEEMRSAAECEEDALIAKGEMESLYSAAFVIGPTLTTLSNKELLRPFKNRRICFVNIKSLQDN